LSCDGKSLISCFERDSTRRVDRETEVISNGAFAVCGCLSKIEFESNSRLCRIDGQAFSRCVRIISIWIPSFVDSIDGSGFCGSNIREVTIAGDNCHFRFTGQYFLRFDGTQLICSFVSGDLVRIDREIAVIGKREVARTMSVSVVTFESGSRLRRIEAFAFSHCCTLKSIWVPSFVETIDGSAFCRCVIRGVSIAEV
jgi:hypothetical protein